jgi:1-deoxy-D-xylulose-5-phosphate reductoisomerase
VHVGPEAAETLARDSEADMVLNALVGSAGLGPTLATLQAGKMLALANKESLVVGGDLVVDLIKGEPERLVPVDFRARRARPVPARRAARGPQAGDPDRFGRPVPGLDARRARQGRRSGRRSRTPVWQMGPKITIDSATLMNKGLEVIEAHYLFGLDYSQIHVVIHPEGIVHAWPSSGTAR